MVAVPSVLSHLSPTAAHTGGGHVREDEAAEHRVCHVCLGQLRVPKMLSWAADRRRLLQGSGFLGQP